MGINRGFLWLFLGLVVGGFSPLSAQRIAVVCPLSVVANDTLLSLKNNFSLDKASTVGVEFAAGFQSQWKAFQPEGDSKAPLVFVDERPDGSYLCDGEVYATEWALAQALLRQEISLVIGPLKGDRSEALAKAFPTAQVINPLSRTVKVQGIPNLMAAVPSKAVEYEQMGVEVAKRCHDQVTLVNVNKPEWKNAAESFFAGWVSAEKEGAGNLVRLFPASESFATTVKSLPPGCVVHFDAEVLAANRLVSALQSSHTLFVTSAFVEIPSLEPSVFIQKNIIWSEVESSLPESPALAEWAQEYRRSMQGEPSRWALHGMAVCTWVWNGLVPLETPFKSFQFSPLSDGNGFVNQGVRFVSLNEQ